ncbi:hypothetical protein Mpsy_2465 [Methanolobus psychrophilus R15]|nr:hypothetical protein Mpsy_2465 [Methanolobus psychrophilus R15]
MAGSVENLYLNLDHKSSQRAQGVKSSKRKYKRSSVNSMSSLAVAAI